MWASTCRKQKSHEEAWKEFLSLSLRGWVEYAAPSVWSLRVLQWWVPRPLPCPSADPALKPVCQGERAHSWAHTALTTPAPPFYLWTWTPFTNWLDHCVRACVTASVYMQSRHIYNVMSLCLSTRSSPGVCVCVCQCACEETVAVRSCSLKGSAAKTFLL